MKTKIWDLRNHVTEDANVDAFNEIKIFLKLVDSSLYQLKLYMV